MADLQVIFMDAGQGDCTLIVYPDGTLTLIDCGSTKSGDEAFAQIWVVLSQFLPAAKNTIETLVLTHPDEDHYNKLRALFNKQPKLTINKIYYGGDINLYKNARESNFTYNLLAKHPNSGPPKNTISATPDASLSRPGDKVNVYILASNASGNPRGRAGPVKNTNSIVLLVEVPGVARLFLMGDAFVDTEDFITQALTVQKKTALLGASGAQVVLKMGHHGSDTSSGAAWVKQIVPNILVVSSGTKTFNRKGMPTATHIDATRAASKLVADTGISQSYVVFDPRQPRGKNFLTRKRTSQGIWTTCFGAEWDGQRWAESGQTWYYGVTGMGSKAKLGVWFGYTGYEEEEDEDE